MKSVSFRLSRKAIRLIPIPLCFAALLSLFFAGCSSTDERVMLTLEERLQASLPEPPPVLSPPVLALFTNGPSFGMHCKIERIPAVPGRKPLEGALLHRGGQFLFAAEAQDKRARGREMTFIWDSASNSGRALNDALPGYAPMTGGAQIISLQSTGRAPADEKVDGRSCTREQVTVTMNDHTEMQLTVWRAADLNGLPLRIQSESGTSRFLIEFSDPKLEQPSETLFEVPQDFTKYESPKAMFDELFRRESLTRRDNKQRPSFDQEEFQRTGSMRQQY